MFVRLVLSLPSRERGLKLLSLSLIFGPGCVAPFTGAWIETEVRREFDNDVVSSLPSRERGLKPLSLSLIFGPGWSLPSRERGLKLDIRDTTFNSTRGRSLHGSVD